MAAAAATALAVPGAASAAFTSPHCGGAPVAGAGASFQNPVQQAWESNQLFKNSAFCGSGAPDVTYQSVGSGAGRGNIGSHEGSPTNTTGARDFVTGGTSPGVRYGASDSAATSAQRAQIEAGLAGTTDDDALLHQIPLTAGAVTVVVNFPNGCSVPSGAGTPFDQPGANDNDHTARFAVDNETIARVFGGDITTWGGLLGPGNIVGSSGGTTDAQCAAKPIIRVVRTDSSGTSTVFESWLQAVRGSYTADFPPAGTNNQRWPNDPGASPAESATFLRGPQNAGVASKVNANDGSIGYVELADARGAGFDKTPNNAATNDFDTTLGGDDTFWLRTKNGSGDLKDPAANSFKSGGGARGANCAGVVFTDKTNPANPPGTLPAPPAGSTDPTLGNWDKVTGVNSTIDYGICTLSYGLVFDDNAKAYNASNGFSDATAEEARARTVKDYLDAVLSDQGQTVALTSDFASMPASVLTAARNGLAAVGWNKSGTSTGGGNTGGGGAPVGGGSTPPPPGGGTTPPPASKPSNVFTVSGLRSTSKGIVTVPVNVPGAGTLKAVAKTTIKVKKGKKTRNKKVTYGSATVTTTASGAVKITVKPSSTIKKALAKGARLKVAVTVTYTPTGGDAATHAKSVTVQGRKAKK